MPSEDKILKIVRFCDSQKMGVFSGVYHKDELLMYMVEPPWNNNEPFKSCIPAGRYKLEKHSTKARPGTFALVNEELGIYHWPPEDPPEEPVRYACLIHIANYGRELEGCAAPGLSLSASPSTGEWMVKSSAKAMNQLRALITYPEEWEVDISWKCGELS